MRASHRTRRAQGGAADHHPHHRSARDRRPGKRSLARGAREGRRRGGLRYRASRAAIDGCASRESGRRGRKSVHDLARKADNEVVSRIDAVSRMPSTPASLPPEGSATEVAKRAAEAAVRAADAALVAANAAILAANAAVHLVDERDNKLIVLGPRRLLPREQPAIPTDPKVIHLPTTSQPLLPGRRELPRPRTSSVPAQEPPASRGRGLRA